ncbi:unnamed protein product [Ilex paraguariensis]
MIEKDMHSECVSLISPLLISAKDVYPDLLYVAIKERDEVTSLELLALDVLIKACEHAEPMDIEVLLNCLQQKLQILMVAVGVEECHASEKMSGLKVLSISETESKENPSKHWNHLVDNKVKAISQIVSQMKNLIHPCGNSASQILSSKVDGSMATVSLSKYSHRRTLI